MSRISKNENRKIDEHFFKLLIEIPFCRAEKRLSPFAVPEGPEGLLPRKSQTVMQSVQVCGVTKGRDLDRFENFEVYTAFLARNISGIYVYAMGI